MSRLGALSILITFSLLLGCGSTPEGFTPEGWDRYQRDHPNGAQVVRWIDNTSQRRNLQRQYIQAFKDARGSPVIAEIVFRRGAERVMLQGGDLKAALVADLQADIQGLEKSIKLRAQLRPIDLSTGEPIKGPPPTVRESSANETTLKQKKAVLQALMQ